MKATLTFSLPEEQESYTESVDGHKWKWSIGRLANWLRYEIKYGKHRNTKQLEEIRSKIFEILQEENLEL
ncbi:MAG TPA: hypothetical protein VN653_10895 [Anaerolineales bacterium]|nr:hypothetical protein [Anaerolineales bacterium]